MTTKKNNRLSRKQKALPHIYASVAGISRDEYEAILIGAAGVASLSDPLLSQSGWCQVMAALETALYNALANLPPDTYRPPQISPPDYWAAKARADGSEWATPRQLRQIKQTWSRMQCLLDPPRQDRRYLHAVIGQANNMPTMAPSALTAAEASRAIDALKSIYTRLYQQAKTAAVQAELKEMQTV